MNGFSLERYLFGSDWMHRFELLWNDPENSLSRLKFINTGEVLFVLEQNQQVLRQTAVDWKKDGKIKTEIQHPKTINVPTFIAPLNVWEAVIYSYYTPIQAVVNRKMEFRGKMRFAMNFSREFRSIADIAVSVNRQFMDL